MLLCGTTTAEVKSGYGLETAAEIRSLEAIRLAAARHPVTGACPRSSARTRFRPSTARNRDRYVALLVEEMIPAVAERSLAVFADVFCEQGVFSVDESRRILLAARARGMKLRIHADELAATGGAELAGELGARSADHLVHVSPAGMRALAGLGLRRDAPAHGGVLPAARPLRPGARADRGRRARWRSPRTSTRAAGSRRRCPSRWRSRASGWGCRSRRRSAAVTVNAACSLDLSDEIGSIEAGKRADLVLLRSARLLDLVRVGVPAIRTVVKDGRVVVRDGRLVAPLPWLAPERAGPGALDPRRLSLPQQRGLLPLGLGDPRRAGRSEERIHAGIERRRASPRVAWTRPAPRLPHGARVALRVMPRGRLCLPRARPAAPVRGAAPARRGRHAFRLPAVPARRDAHADRASR